MSSKIAEFADAMIQHFPPFRQWEEYQEKAWAETLVAELAGFTEPELKRAQREMIRTRKPSMPKPPMVSECIAACNEARRWLESERNEGKLPSLQSHEVSFDWSAERIKLAYELMHTALGKQACREGWQLSMWHFCRENRRHPRGNEIDACKRASKGFDQILEEIYRTGAGVPVAAIKPLVGLGESMNDRRKKIYDEVMGK